MKRIEFSEEEARLLRDTSNNHPKCYVRKKALTVLNVAKKHDYRSIQKHLTVAKQSIANRGRYRDRNLNRKKNDGILGRIVTSKDAFFIIVEKCAYSGESCRRFWKYPKKR